MVAVGVLVLVRWVPVLVCGAVGASVGAVGASVGALGWGGGEGEAEGPYHL